MLSLYIEVNLVLIGLVARSEGNCEYMVAYRWPHPYRAGQGRSSNPLVLSTSVTFHHCALPHLRVCAALQAYKCLCALQPLHILSAEHGGEVISQITVIDAEAKDCLNSTAALTTTTSLAADRLKGY